MSTKYAYRLVSDTDWSQIDQNTGIVPYAAVDTKDGFFHMSTAAQAQTTAQRYFNGQTNVRLLQVNLSTLDQSKLKWEAVSTRNNELFPHYYDYLNLKQHVEQVFTLETDGDGNHIFPASM